MNLRSHGNPLVPASPGPCEAIPTSDETLFRAVFETAGAGLAVVDPETGCLLRANPRCCEILGYSQDELQRLTMLDLTHPDDREQDRQLQRRLAAGELSQGTVVKRCLRKDGGVVWGRVIHTLTRDERGQARYLTAVIEDITKERQSEDALRESEAHFRRMADCASVMLWTTDPSGACTYLNAQWYEFTGTSPAQGLGLGWLECTHPDDRHFTALVFRDANARRAPFRAEYRVRYHDGTYRWAMDSGTPRFGDNGEYLGYVGSVVDITERLEAEQEILRLNRDLQRRVTELQTLIDVLPVGIGIAEDAACRRITTNPAFAQMLALSPQDNASLSAPDGERPTGFRVVQNGRELDAEELTLQIAASRGLPVREMEVEVVHADGKRLTLLEYAAPLFDEAGQPRGSVGAFLDITPLKQVEATLRELDRRKDEFLAMLGHELRNPLATITSAAHLLATLPLGDPAAPRLHARIAHQGQHLARLVDDLLDVTRIQEGKIDLRREAVDVADAVHRSLEAVQETVSERRHHLTLALPEAPLQVDADPARFEQILTNLLSNAAKYTEPGGEITVTAAREGEMLRLSVADTGVGIGSDHLPHLFQLFAQTEHTLDRSAGGLGIGLHLVRTLVELHGGAVTAYSDGPGRGSVFTLRLPLAKDEGVDAPGSGAGGQGSGAGGRGSDPTLTPAPVSSSSSKPVPNPNPNPNLNLNLNLNPIRVLVVDDNRDAAETLGELVSLWGHLCGVCFSGPDALETATRWKPDIVVLDIGMPEMDGYEVARRLRGEHGFTGMLIALSGYGQEDDRRHSREVGFDLHLTKPVQPETLQQALANLAR